MFLRNSIRRPAVLAWWTAAGTLFATPAFAATSFEEIDKGALALLTIFTVLIVAIVFEATRMAIRKPSPAKTRGTTRRVNWSGNG